jgi:hypothetical protein
MSNFGIVLFVFVRKLKENRSNRSLEVEILCKLVYIRDVLRRDISFSVTAYVVKGPWEIYN